MKEAILASEAHGFTEGDDEESDGFSVIRSKKVDKVVSGAEGEGEEPHELDRPLECAKDFRGRYYYEKFKVLPGRTCEVLLGKLGESYLQGLMWCLAYYVKGCISWTWYFPYHYGPLLQVSGRLFEYVDRATSFSLPCILFEEQLYSYL